MTRGLLLSTLAVCFLALLLGGCAPPYYITQAQSPTSPQKVTSASIVRVRAIDFSKIPLPAGYDAPQWTADTKDIMPEFFEQIGKEADGEGVAAKVKNAQLEDAIADGVVIESVVVGYRPEYNGFSGGFDYLKVRLQAIDAASKAVLYEGTVEVTSKAYGVGMGFRAGSQRNRLSFCAWNLAKPIVSIVKTGKIDPEKY
jgi:hypothetical protein